MDKKQSQANDHTLDPRGLLHLAVVYLVWSSTYLAIRLAVREGAGFPPFTLGFMRALPAGILLLTWGFLQKGSIRLNRRELLILAGSGMLLWLGGNGLVTFAEQRADSGLAALMVAGTPIWVAIIEALIDRKLPSLQIFIALLIGFGGIGVLTAPSLMTGIRADVVAIVALLGAEICWGLGSVLQARKSVRSNPRVSAGYQMLFGAIGFFLVARLLNEPVPTPTPEAWGAWLYLVLVGSVIAFTSYVTVLRLLPTRIVMTYAYVNPVLAVVLGWLWLGEEITGWTLAGSALVLLGVAGVFRERNTKARPVETTKAE
jgi:drug/metabolite transporter (DMT)-like permease